MPKLRSVAALSVMLLAANAFAYSVSVNKVSGFDTSFTALAMLPGTGPTGFDTIWLDNLLAQKLAARGITVLPASVVRQAMFDLEIKQLTDDTRKQLAQKLNVDAFIVAAVDAWGTENAGTVGVFVAGIFTAVPSDRNTGSVQLAIIAADSGKVLMQGAGHGQSELRSKRGVIGKTFDRILAQVFTPQFFAARRSK